MSNLSAMINYSATFAIKFCFIALFASGEGLITYSRNDYFNSAGIDGVIFTIGQEAYQIK